MKKTSYTEMQRFAKARVPLRGCLPLLVCRVDLLGHRRGVIGGILSAVHRQRYDRAVGSGGSGLARPATSLYSASMPTLRPMVLLPTARTMCLIIQSVGHRFLSRVTRMAIRSLVKRWCANYDKDIGCLPLDCESYMLGKCWTSAYCRYFRSAVLRLDPVLERSLTVETVAVTRPCAVCGRAFLPDGRQRYCSPACARAARRQKQRGYMRKYRG